MPKALEVQIAGLDEMVASFKQAPGLFMTVFNKAIKKSIFVLTAAAKMETPVDLGFLRNSMRESFENLIGTLDNTAPYALFVHEGTKPHFPPLDAITPWANRHGIPPFMVAMSIAAKGTKGVPFFDLAIDAQQLQVQNYFDVAMEDFKNQL